MLVDPATTDGLDVLEAQMVQYDLRDLYAIAPLPAAMARDAEDENEEDEESGDDTDDSDDNSQEDSDESDEEDDEEDDESTRKLIKDLREENKARRIKLRQATKENERLKAEVARLKKRSTGSGNTRKKVEEEPDEDDEQEDLTKLTPREEAAEIKSALVDVMQDLDLNKKYRRIITALVDPDEIDIEVSDTGKVSVSGLKEAIEELLEDYPEWQNKKADEDDEEDRGSRRTGPSTNRRKRGSGNGLDKATLAKKYPALASR
jgi:phosphatidylinositol kinase/protein kinase (PI-3  family)